MTSLLNNNFEVTQSVWVVSLLRKPHGSNPEHAFIIVQGSYESGRTLLRRYDLFISSESKEYDIYIKESNVAQVLSEKTLIQDFLRYEQVQGIHWQLSCEKGEELHQLVKASKDQLNRPYNMSGDVATAPKTAPNSDEKSHGFLSSNPVSKIIGDTIFSPSGHSCFTWAREKLRDLQLEHITRSLPTKIEEITMSIPSRLLQNEKECSHSQPESIPNSICRLV